MSHMLLHLCCGPCSTYTINRLREENHTLTGLWYNPNVHSWQEHELRRESAARYAQAVGLEVIWPATYDMPQFLRLVVGHERFRERCLLCYRMRMEYTGRIAAESGFTSFTTTLLISPYQDQDALRAIGEEVGRQVGVPFYFENFRRGWAERGRLTKEHNLYQQPYCGCIYSEWERYNKEPLKL